MLKQKIEKLQNYIKEAEILLKDEINFSKGNRDALADMVSLAKGELDGSYKLPFSNNRKFYEFEKEARIDFATSRYTMVPTYPKQTNYSTYGLLESIEWLKTTDVRLYDDAKKQRVLDTAKDFCSSAKIGAGVSEYPVEKIEKLKQAISEFDKDNIASVTNLLNTTKEARLSVTFRGDLTDDSYMYFDEAGLRKIVDNAKKDKVFSKRITEIVEKADKYSLEQLKILYSYIENDINYDEYNKIDPPWSSTERRASFGVPENAVSLKIKLTLPAVDNEEGGLGHIWLDNFDILTASGSDLPIPCSNFSNKDEFQKSWEKIVVSGAPVAELSDKYSITGGHSMYFENPTANDEGGFVCTKKIVVEKGAWYSLDMNVKVDGKCKRGLVLTMEYFDENDDYISDYVFEFNKKSWPLDCMEFGLYSQCCALSYYITGNIEYAQKAKYMLLIYMDNFNQGSHHWLMFQSRPEGNDCYGAVQGGRLLIVISNAYSYIKNLGVFTKEEKEQFYANIDYQLRYMLDLRDRTEMTYEEAQMYSGNWHSDMSIGTSMILATMEDFPNRKAWMLNAYFVLRGQLETHLGADGSWPESIRYNHAVLKHFSTYALHLVFETGENWFSDTRLTEIYNYIIKVQTPKFSVMDNAIGTPPFGDHQLQDGAEFSYFSSYLGVIEPLNKKLADEMHEAWIRGGRKLSGIGNEQVLIEPLLFNGDYYMPTDGFKLDLKSTADFKNSGHYVFRGFNDDDTQNYAAIMSIPKKMAHGHLDQGAFISYYHDTPLVMDTGIEGYFDASALWHISSYSHSCLLFSTKRKSVGGGKANNGLINLSAGDYCLKRGYNDTPVSSKVLDVNLGEKVDTMSIEIENIEGIGKHIRNIEFNKDTGVIILDDKLIDFEDGVMVSFPVITNNSRVEGNTVYCECLNDVTLKIEVVSPYESIEVDNGRIFLLEPGSRNLNVKAEKKVQIIDVIRIKGNGKDGVKTILTPFKK